MTGFKEFGRINPFEDTSKKKEREAGREAALRQALGKLIESTPRSLAAEMTLPFSYEGTRGQLIGRLSGDPLVRTWDAYSVSFHAETIFSTGLSDGPNGIKVTNWTQALHDLGKPTSIIPAWNRVEVTWMQNADKLIAQVAPEQLIEAGVPFELTHTTEKNLQVEACRLSEILILPTLEFARTFRLPKENMRRVPPYLQLR